MKEMVKIRYRSVICHDDDKIRDVYEGEAVHDWQLAKDVWQLEHPSHGTMTIEISGDSLTLQHHASVLKMVLHKNETNPYQTAYGTLLLQAYLKKLEIHKNHLAIVYYLSDSGHIISRCYLTIDVINADLS